MSQLVTSLQKTLTNIRFLDDIKTSNSYYLITCMNDSNNALENTSNLWGHSVYDNMIQGKKITANSVCPVIRNIPYESNKIFDVYDDSVDLLDKDFYTVVNESSYYHVFKCLNNNLNSPSTVPPSFEDIGGSNSTSYYTSDGYQWKYMYSVDSATVDKFASIDYFPLVANSSVESSAINGSIDTVFVENQGKGYDNYLEGVFKASDIKINGNSSLFAVTNSVASSANGFYTGCLFYISAGAGVGENRIITDYISNGNGNFIVLDKELTTVLNGSNYEIYPSVKIFNSGTQTVNAIARAIINSYSSNSVSRVEILEAGKDYTYHTAEIVANSVVGVSQKAILRSVYTPKGGHGSNTQAELRCKTAGISVTLSNSEGNTLLTNNDFNEIGILKNPKFSNVVFNLKSSLISSFLPNEKILNVDMINIGNCTTNSNSTTIVLSIQNNLKDDIILLSYPSANAYQVANCVSSNGLNTILSANALFSENNVKIMILKTKSESTYLNQIDSNSILVDDVTGEWNSNDTIIGINSYTIASVNNIIRNDISKNFNTFIQSYKYDATSITGSFEKNETLIQDESSGVLRSFSVSGNNITFYINDQKGIYNHEVAVTGKTSNARCFIFSTKYPELKYGSGELLYLEKTQNITRSVDQDENFVFYLEF